VGLQVAGVRANPSARALAIGPPSKAGLWVKPDDSDSINDQRRRGPLTAQSAPDSRSSDSIGDAPRAAQIELVISKSVMRQLASASGAGKLHLGKASRRLQEMPWPPEPGSGVSWSSDPTVPGGLVLRLRISFSTAKRCGITLT